MTIKVFTWFGLVSVIILSFFGLRFYLSLLTFFVSFLVGVITVLYFAYDSKNIFSVDLDILEDPLQQTSFSVQSPKILELFQDDKPSPKFDNRITGSETVDSFLNEIITIIINDYVTHWYEILTDDKELTKHTIKRVVLSASANVSNRVKSVNWIHLLSTRFPEELTKHLKLFKQSSVRLKHIQLMSAKELASGNSKPCKQEEKKTHRRNKSDTDLSWLPDTQTYGKSKFYSSSENLEGKTLKDLFFDLECSIENSQICRDMFCNDKEKEYALLCEVAETILYLVSPEEVWRCHALKMLLIDLLSSVVLKPLIDLLSDPDNINRTIVKTCTRDSTLPSDLFLMVIRCCGDAEELDATLELVHKDIQKLHSKDSAGEWELPDRQKLSSLEYLTRIIQARRATLGPQEGRSSSTTDKIPEEVTRALKFLRATASWRSNAQYLLEIELNEADATNTSKAVIDNLRSSALELCDLYLAPNRPSVRGIPDNCHAELVRKITMEGEEFTNFPAACFDDVQKCICDALEDDPTWQADLMMDDEDGADRANGCVEFKEDKTESSKYTGESLSVPGSSRHNRSRSDIVGNFAQKMINESATPSSLSSANSGISLSHSNISQNVKNFMSPLSACIIETALVQEKGRPFGIYAIAVTRLSDNELWHIYRRYSDFHDLHTSIKDKWPELGHLPFPAKKTFQNTSRNVLETRKRMLNHYLQSLVNLAREARYMALLSSDYLGGFLSAEVQTEKQNNTIDAVLVNSLKAGMRTLKNMPDQFANTVDGVMDGISKVFQGKSAENFNEGINSGNSSDTHDDDESIALKLLEEVLGIRGLWLRRRLLAPLRTLIADRVNKKVYEFVSSLTSPRNVVQYLKTFKQWLTTRNNANYSARDAATKARTRVAAKVALLSACSDDLKHIVGTDTARRGLLTVFDLFQTEEINKRLIFVFLEAILTDLFPDNNIQSLFKKIYSNSPRVPLVSKKSTLV